MSISVGNKVELRLSLTIWNESRTSLIFWVGTMESKSTDPKFPNVSFSELRLAATFSSSVLMSESNFVDSTASVIASWRNCQTVRIILDRRQMAAKTPYYFIPEEETWKRLKLTNSATYNQHLLRYYNRRVETRAILLGDIFFAIPHVCVCKCMCMCVWVCACMCGCVGVWVCGCVGVWACGRVGVWIRRVKVLILCPVSVVWKSCLLFDAKLSRLVLTANQTMPVTPKAPYWNLLKEQNYEHKTSSIWSLTATSQKYN